MHRQHKGASEALRFRLYIAETCVASLNIWGLPVCLPESRTEYSGGLSRCLRDLLFCLLHGDSALFLSCFSGDSFPDSDINHLN